MNTEAKRMSIKDGGPALIPFGSGLGSNCQTGEGLSMKAYSLNDEDFIYDTIGDVMNALEDSDDLIVGAEYFEVETESADLAEYLDADTMLETAEERAYEELGECAEDAFSVTKEAAEELDAALKTWAAKHLPSGYWRCVGKSRRLTVTAEDVAEYSRPEESK